MIRFELTQARRLDVAAEIGHGQLCALYGPSGAGKTTLLRMLAGLDKPDSGFLEVAGERWFDGKRALPPQRRKVGMVFQDHALFPHLTVRDNIAFGAAHSDSALIDQLLEWTELGPFATRRPASLSGGQRQRVALARALACRPRLLLLDEPLSALDDNLRAQLQDMIADLHRRFELTTLLVSHDLAEVFRLANKVLQLDQGKLIAQGTPAELFLPSSGDSSRCQLHARVLAIRPADVMWRLTVLIGNERIELLVSRAEAETRTVGDRIVLSAGQLSPLPTALPR